MNSHSKLKSVALAVGPVGWKWWDSNSVLRLTTEFTGRNGADGDAISAYRDSVQCPELIRAFIEAANPAAVLELIAENERLARQWGDRPAYRTPEYESKRDAMWRRAHMVATSKGYDHINMAIASAPTACADCMGCGGEWQGESQPNSVCEICKGNQGKTLEAERDQLKTEIEALRARLSKPDPILIQCLDSAVAEMDQLEKDAARWRFVRSPIGTESPLAIWREGRIPLFSGMADAAVDDAMAKAAQS